MIALSSEFFVEMSIANLLECTISVRFARGGLIPLPLDEHDLLTGGRELWSGGRLQTPRPVPAGATPI